jgi:butyrate kinase
MGKKILAINPGSTSTKISIYDDQDEIFTETIRHKPEELAPFTKIADQFDFRKDLVASLLKKNGVDPASLDAVVGRGGQIFPVVAGGYRVNNLMKQRILNGDFIEHASNLGALIADAIASPLGIPAFIYDSVASDEIYGIARITGLPEIMRRPYSHVLNSRAMARKYAQRIGKRYEECNFLVAHIGGGVSINVHEKGRIVDSIESDGGPFSIERSGSIPLSYIVDIAYSGKYSRHELTKKLSANGGVKAHLDTNDMQEVERRIRAGDKHAKLIYEALAYQIAKGIGEMAPVLKGVYDAIIVTGGAAHSKILTDWITERISFISRVAILPGENEMEALTLGALRILNGEEQAREYFDHEEFMEC